MPFRTLLFDFDGTLIDHFAAIHRTHVHTLRHFGLPEPTLAQVRRAVGRGIEHAIADLVGSARVDLVPQAVPVYKEYWAKTMLDDVVLLPGARELLASLKQRGVRTAVFTNKMGSSSREICAHLKIDGLLDGVFGALDTPWLKPDARFTRHVLDQLGAKVDSTLFVGDSPYDIQAAHNAGLPCWCVTTGTHSAEELKAAGGDAIHADLASVAVGLAGV